MLAVRSPLLYPHVNKEAQHCVPDDSVPDDSAPHGGVPHDSGPHDNISYDNATNDNVLHDNVLQDDVPPDSEGADTASRVDRLGRRDHRDDGSAAGGLLVGLALAVLAWTLIILLIVVFL